MAWLSRTCRPTLALPAEKRQPNQDCRLDALGAFVPATILNGAGAVIGTKLNAFDPVGSLGAVVPHWFHFLFLLIAIVSMIWANIINTYSSGLNLQAMGIRIVRYKTVLVDAVLATGFVVYALWVSNFTSSLENFLALAIWWIAPWTASTWSTCTFADTAT